MRIIGEYIEKWRKYKKERHMRTLRKRAEEIFTVEEYDGQIWYFCNRTKVFPCSFVGTVTENDIIVFLNEMRKFYIESE